MRAMGRPVDRSLLMDRVGGDRGLLEELSDMYSNDRPALLDRLNTAITTGDAAEVCRQSHRLKGTFGSLAAPGAAEAARRLEEIGRSGDLSQAESAFEDLSREARRVEQELRSFEGQSWGAS